MAKKKPEWDELPCPVCREPANVNARRCPHCTTIYTPEQLAARRSDFDFKLKSAGVALLVIVLLFIGFCAYSGSGESEPDPDFSDTPVTQAAEPVTRPEGSATPEETRALTFYWRELMDHAARCDQANRPVQAALDGSDVYGAYRAATAAKTVCDTSADDISNMAIPAAITGDARTKLAETNSQCRVAYRNRSEALAVLQRALDGDVRPSVVEDYRLESEAAGNGVVSCVAGGMLVATMMGVPLDQLTNATGEIGQ